MSLFDALKNMIQPSYIQWFTDWEKTALVDDKKGLHVLEFIINSRGQKKYDGYLSKDTGVKAQLKSGRFNHTATLALLRQKEIITRYTIDYGYIGKILKPKNNIFYYKKVSEMEFRDFLQQRVLQFLDAWVALNDDLKFQE